MSDLKTKEQDPILIMLELMCEQLEEQGNCSLELLAAFAVYLGWREIERTSPSETWKGYPIESTRAKRYRQYDPDVKTLPIYFFQTYHDVLDLVPDRCVESYHTRFDGSYLAKISPRGDLALGYVTYQSNDLIKAMGGAILRMRIKMRRKQLSEIN